MRYKKRCRLAQETTADERLMMPDVHVLDEEPLCVSVRDVWMGKVAFKPLAWACDLDNLVGNPCLYEDDEPLS